MLHLAQMMPEYEAVMGIYGIGPTVGPQLMGEIGDIRDFANRRALVGLRASIQATIHPASMCPKATGHRKAALRCCANPVPGGYYSYSD